MSKQERIIQIDCDPEIFGTKTIPVTVYKKRIHIRPKSKPIKTMTFGDEVDELVKEWYAERGLPVPPEDLVGSEIDAANAAQDKAYEEARAKAEEEVPSVVPEYGTPEFWAYHRAKKAAENKRREAEGLPPLPTKKELEAEKAKKKAEREAAKAAKEAAKALSAATKEAAKAAKALSAAAKKI
jgi:hypothetical protein